MDNVVPLNKYTQDMHPIYAFPEYIQKIITHYSDAKGYPSEYFIQAFLAAVSAATGRSLTLNTGNYTAIASLWCIILGKKGFVKSEPLTDAFKPIKKFQFEIYKRHQSDLDELETLRVNNPKTKYKDLPEPQKILLSDTTPEKLVTVLANNPKGCAMVYDEIAGFVSRFDRYKSGGDEQMFLSLFNGDTILRDRMNSSGNAFAKNSYLTIIGTTQPAVLREAFFSKSQSGFFDRWLITQPENIKKQYPNQFGINPIEEGKYESLFTPLLQLEYQEDESNQMRYSTKSYKIINEYQCWIIDKENETDNDDYRGILAKMEIYLHKFALILQMLEYSLSKDFNDLVYVSEESANGAVMLTKYFTEQATKVRTLSPVELLKDVWVDIYNDLPEVGKEFDRKHFVKICKVRGLSDRQADNFLKENGLRAENSLFYKVKHGLYTKNLF